MVYLVDLLLLVDAELARAAVNQQQKTTDNRENLEEVVLVKVLVGVMLVELEVSVQVRKCASFRGSTYSPEVVDKNIEDAKNDNQQGGAELGLEADNNHDASHETDQRDQNAPNGPLAAEYEADEEENQQDTAGQLEVHLAVLFLKLGKTREDLGLAHP